MNLKKSYDPRLKYTMETSLVRVVSLPHVNVGGAETGQLLAELLCLWILSFSAAPCTHNSTLSRTLVYVHTCLHLWPYAHTKTHTGVIHADTCTRAHTHIDRENYKLTKSAAAPVPNQLSQLPHSCQIIHSNTHICTYP